MKKILVKIPAMLAMAITLFSFYVYVESIVESNSDVWIFSVILAILSMLFYFIDAIISLIKAIKKENTKFNLILTAVLIVAIPMILIFAGSGKDHYNVIWNIYYLAMFILEIISIKKCIKS